MNAKTLSTALIGRTVHEFCLVAEDLRITHDADGMPDSFTRGLRQTFRYLREAVNRHPARGTDTTPFDAYMSQFQRVSITTDFSTLWRGGHLSLFAEDLWPWPSVALAMPDSMVASGAILTTVDALARRMVADTTLQRWLSRPTAVPFDTVIDHAIRSQSLPELAALIDHLFPDPDDAVSLPTVL